MSTWYKVAWIDPLFAAFNAVAPGRGHAEDGTIGDAAHQAESSGHNPDDTPGVRAERQDADSKPEVRAADVDSTGSWPAGLSMERCVQAVLHGPVAERDRLIYIIFNRRIWRAATGWRQETYTGSDPHDRHAHFSGNPDSDDDGRPWTSILNLGDDMLKDEKIVSTSTPGMGDRDAATLLSDIWNVVMRGRTQGGDLWGDSPFAKLLAAAARPALDAATVAAALAPLLTDHLGVEVSQDQLVAALNSDAGQAALVRAANAAEDS